MSRCWLVSGGAASSSRAIQASSADSSPDENRPSWARRAWCGCAAGGAWTWQGGAGRPGCPAAGSSPSALFLTARPGALVPRAALCAWP